jgi:hypothetical protein
MEFQMGHGGFRPGAGRKKGVPNKATLDVQARLAALGCDPIEGMALIAMDAANPPELRGRMYSELAQYVAPKRKAVEMGGPNGRPVEVEAVCRPPRMTREEWLTAREHELAARTQPPVIR